MGGAMRTLIGQMLHPFYALHLVSLLFYFVLRFFAFPSISPSSQLTLLRWEVQAGLSLLMVLVVKYVKSNTVEGFLGDALLYAKCVVALLVGILDPRMLSWYLFFFTVIFLLWHQPPSSESGSVVHLTPLQLESQLSENRSSAWLVQFGAAWSPRCNHFQRIFSELSSDYSTSGLHFGKVDIGCFPKTAEKFGIELGAALRQLPTLVLFENGVEVARLPHSTYDGLSPAPALNKSLVIRQFELDHRLLRSLSKRAGPPRTEASAKL